MASGEVDQGVIDNDIDAEIPEADAHENYGIRMSDWLSLNALHLGLLTQAQAQPALLNFAQYEADTQEFLAPFAIAAEMEQVGYTSEMVRQSQVSTGEWGRRTFPYRHLLDGHYRRGVSGQH